MPVIRIVLLLLLVGVILAFKFLPWYVLVGIAVVLVLGAKFLGGKFAVWLFSMPFRAKGKVLRNATIEVHSIVACEQPPEKSRQGGSNTSEGVAHEEDEQDEITDEPEGPRAYYRLDVTISPRPSTGAFHYWEIGELLLTLPDTKPMDDASDVCQIVELKVFLDGQFVPDDEGYKLPGPQRLQLVLAIRPDVRQLAFRYYFETFGEITVPASKVVTQSRTGR